MTSSLWVEIAPSNLSDAARKAFIDRVRATLAPPKRRAAAATKTRINPRDRTAVDAALLVLTDLTRQGWQLRLRGKRVEVAPPPAETERDAEKARVQRQLLVERDDQLRESAVREFIASMERRRPHKKKLVSIFSLMRDGSRLRTALEEAARASGTEREALLATTVRPYLQFVDESETCEHTGLRLIDIWRYFRHTWTKAYRSIPGRTMMVLVRDAAADYHPVIGIAALSSAMVQISVRDRWIGWQADKLVEELTATPDERMLSLVDAVVTSSLKSIFVDDLLEDGIVTLAKLKKPDEETIKALEAEADLQRQEHHRHSDVGEHKRFDNESDDEEVWTGKARTHLFRSKRAKLLAQMLRAQLELTVAKRQPTKLEQLNALLQSAAGRQAITFAVRKAKGDRVGVCIADLNVCGAVAPYNEILGGKLVAMLMASPEVGEAYRARYCATKSIIASGIAARPVIKPPELVLLGTTSLYGTGSSQYNRLKMRADAAGGAATDHIEYIELGATEGYGTLQFGKPALDAIARLVAQRDEGQRVNSIFGEGVNPRMRKVRDGLDEIGLPSDALLRHGAQRVVYAIPLAKNFRDYLLGIDPTPQYILPQAAPRETTSQIVAWWTRRWLSHRVERVDVLARVAKHHHAHPIRHGARVTLPPADEDQLAMFAGD